MSSIGRRTAIRRASRCCSRVASCPCCMIDGRARGETGRSVSAGILTMDELDRLFGLLVAALARETRIAVPFPAADVYERLVPYRSNRSHLNVATHQDYEMAVLRLLSGERNYVQLEPENVREAMQREIATINPDPAYFRSFPEAQVMVNGHAAERALLADRAYAPPPPPRPPGGPGARRRGPGGYDGRESRPDALRPAHRIPGALTEAQGSARSGA